MTRPRHVVGRGGPNHPIPLEVGARPASAGLFDPTPFTPLAMRLALLALLAALPVAAGQAPSILLDMDDERESTFFRDAGGALNPTVSVEAGTRVVVEVRNVGSLPHNLHVEGLGETPCCQDPGETARLVLDIPADATGTIPYWCVNHRSAGMEGVLRVQAAGAAERRVAIASPAEGASVAPTFTIRASAEGVTLQQGGHHLHYTVNGTLAPGGDAPVSNLTVSVVGRGFHLLRVEVMDAEHAPLDPPVFAERIVFVDANAPPESPTSVDVPTPTGGTPPTDDSPGLALPLVALTLVAAAWARRRAR